MFWLCLNAAVFAQEYGFDVLMIADQNLFKNAPDAPVFEHFTDEADLPLAGVACLFRTAKAFSGSAHILVCIGLTVIVSLLNLSLELKFKCKKLC